jgi:hypothetical protein
MTLKNTAEASRETRRREQLDLDLQYGNIGISAVAAAVRYQGKDKNLTYVPAAPEREGRS